VSKGKKLAGAAQRRSRNGILHQGSVSVENMNHSRKRLLRNFIAAYSEWFHISFEPFQLSNELFEEAEKICSLKYSSDSWNSSGKIYPEKVMKKVKNRY
jgi:lipoate-protein ligase A